MTRRTTSAADDDEDVMGAPPRRGADEPLPYHQIPSGYRQGVITAITVLLGITLAFFRFWGFEAEGQWTPSSAIAAGTLILAVVLQIIALFRSLRLEDDEPSEYRKTVIWFVASAVALLVGLLIAMIVFA